MVEMKHKRQYEWSVLTNLTNAPRIW